MSEYHCVFDDNNSESENLQSQEDWTSEFEPTIPEWFKDTSKKTKVVNGVTLYRCSRCGQYKSKNEYYKDKRVPIGIRHRCKSCYHK